MTTSDLSAWVGRSKTVSDRLDPNHAASIAVTLGQAKPGVGSDLAPLWHWAYFLETVP